MDYRQEEAIREEHRPVYVPKKKKRAKLTAFLRGHN